MPRSREQLHDPREQRDVGARQHREADGVGVLLEGGLRHLLGRLVQAGVDHLEAGVTQRAGDHLRAPVVAVEAGLGDHDAIAPPHQACTLASRTGRCPLARVRCLLARSPVPARRRRRRPQWARGDVPGRPEADHHHLAGAGPRRRVLRRRPGVRHRDATRRRPPRVARSTSDRSPTSSARWTRAARSTSPTRSAVGASGSTGRTATSSPSTWASGATPRAR